MDGNPIARGEHGYVGDVEEQIELFSMLPLYKEEMDLKLRKGTDELLEKLDEFNVTDIIDISRQNVAKNGF